MEWIQIEQARRNGLEWNLFEQNGNELNAIM